MEANMITTPKISISPKYRGIFNPIEHIEHIEHGITTNSSAQPTWWA